jgi:hypothetical protein
MYGCHVLFGPVCGILIWPIHIGGFMTNLIHGTFKKPAPQSKLNGELGLTVQDIATSLGIEPKTVRRDLIERSVLERIKSCGFNAVPFGTPNPTNGIEYTDYVLDVNASKWFIAKYNNDVADQYLAYLVKVESDAVAEGVTNHIDPTGIAKMMANPDFIIGIANKWKEAEARAELAERTKAWISDKKTATAMGKLGAATNKIISLENRLGEGENWKTVTGWKVVYPELQKYSDVALGGRLSKMAKEHGIEIKTTPHTKYGKVNVYSKGTVLKFLSE